MSAATTLPAPDPVPECDTCGAPLPVDRQDETHCDPCFGHLVAELAEARDDERAHERAHGPEVF